MYAVLTPTPNECGNAGVWTVKSMSGFVAAPSVGQVTSNVRPWTHDTPCLLEFRLTTGQHLNVTLLDFTSTRGDVSSHVAFHSETTSTRVSFYQPFN